MFWNSLFTAGLCTLSWDIILQTHLKPEAEGLYKVSTTIICVENLAVNYQHFSSMDARESSLGCCHPPAICNSWESVLKNKQSEADTPYGGGKHFQSQSKGLPTAPPSLLLLGKTIPKWSYSLSWYKQSPNKSVLLLSFWHSPLPWSKQLPPYTGPQFFCLLHKPDQPSFFFLVSFSFSYICPPDLKSSVCCWETSLELDRFRARCLLGGLPIWSLSEQVAQPTLVFWGDAWTR